MKKKIKTIILVLITIYLLSIVISIIDMGTNIVSWIPIIGPMFSTAANSTTETIQMGMNGLGVLFGAMLLKMFR